MRFALCFLFITTCYFLFSCDPCKNLDCLSDSIHGQFRIVDAATNRDLVFGPNRIYDKNEIRFFSVNGSDTTFFDYEPIKFGGANYDSILYVKFIPRTDLAYLQLSIADVDTLRMTYQTKKTKCCAEITNIVNFRYNDKTDIPGSEGTQELRK
jgi:hypothetical protein